jgi:hypothetical protein
MVGAGLKPAPTAVDTDVTYPRLGMMNRIITA